jgi:hypothetical protein
MIQAMIVRAGEETWTGREERRSGAGVEPT